MDNVTHTLVGLTLGEAAYQIRKFNDKPDNPTVRRCYLVCSVIANNFPDLDILYSGFLGELGYLLHHRGHTHTLLFAIPQALLLFGVCFFLAKFKKWELEKPDLKGILALSFLGGIAHLWLDGLNSYGIHPYWPFKNHWIYGDSLFIVEPWFWVTLSLAIVRMSPNRYFQIAMGAVALTGLGLAWGTGLVPREICLAMTVWSLLLYFGLRFVSDYRKIFIGLLAFSLILLGFNRTSKFVKREFPKYYLSQYDQTRLRELVLSPFPANPFCWGIITVEQLEEKTHYFMRRGVLAPFPQIMDLKKCEELNFITSPNFEGGEKLPQVHWLGQIRVDIKALKQLQDNACLAREFLQFARVPYLQKEEGKIRMLDLRFVRKGVSSFAEVVLVDNPRCLDVEAPWVAPRQREIDELPAD